MSHICNLKFLVVTLKKVKRNNVNNVFYENQYIQNITVSTCNQCKNYWDI